MGRLTDEDLNRAIEAKMALLCELDTDTIQKPRRLRDAEKEYVRLCRERERRLNDKQAKPTTQ